MKKNILKNYSFQKEKSFPDFLSVTMKDAKSYKKSKIVHRWINFLELSQTNEIGTKAKNLKIILKKVGPLVPESLIISKEFYGKLIESNKIRDPYSFNWEYLRIPARYADIIIKKIKQKFGGRPLVIRSSATCEDTPMLSFAGQYSSFLNIVGRKNILKAIRLCYGSMFSVNASVYASHKDIKLSNETMAILIQEVIPVKISGIIFTMNPVNGDKSEIIIEYSRGLGDKLASGHQKPTYLKIKKDDYRKKCPLFLKDLIRIAIKLEKIFHGPQDIEWGYNDGKIFIFQSRPITVTQDIPSLEIIKSKKSKMIGKGKIASRGQAGADLRLIKNKKDYLNLKKNEIIYGKKLDISIVGKINHIAGIITSGGILSHIAVIAREFNIPCLVEPEGFDASDYEGQKILLDGYKGKIFILK